MVENLQDKEKLKKQGKKASTLSVEAHPQKAAVIILAHFCPVFLMQLFKYSGDDTNGKFKQGGRSQSSY